MTFERIIKAGVVLLALSAWALAGLTVMTDARAASIVAPSVPSKTKTPLAVGSDTSPSTGRSYPTINLGGRSSIYAFDGNTLGNVSALSATLNAQRSTDYPSGHTVKSTGPSNLFLLQTTDSGTPQLALMHYPSQSAGTTLSLNTPPLGSSGLRFGSGALQIYSSGVSGASLSVDSGGRVSASKPCVANYGRFGTSTCFKTTALSMTSVPTTCTLITAPDSQPKQGFWVYTLNIVSTQNVAGLNSAVTEYFTDAACTIPVARVSASGREFTATIATEMARHDAFPFVATDAGSSIYIKGTFSVNSSAQYEVRGYND